MKIFLAGIIQGSLVEAAIHRQDWRSPIQAALAKVAGAEVYCHYTHHPNSITYDLPRICETLAEGNRLAGECDVLIAYVPSASMGTAIEMHQAHCGGAVVLTVSPMTANWVLRAYSDRIFPDIAALEQFLLGDEFPALMKRRRGDAQT